jgi:hypothetical protein
VYTSGFGIIVDPRGGSYCITITAWSILNYLNHSCPPATFIAVTEQTAQYHTMSGTNPLSADKILELAAKALGSGQPRLQTPYEAVALIGHACMTAVDFRLVGLGEDHDLGQYTRLNFALIGIKFHR